MLQILVLFSGFTAFAESNCTLLSKDVEQRKYYFNCNNQTVNVQCDNKNKLVCGVTIKDALKSMRFNISEDEFKSFNLFSAEEQKKVECDVETQACGTKKDVCKKYEDFFEKTRQKLVLDIRSSNHCDSVLGKSVQNIGAFSAGMVGEVDFYKNSCGESSASSIQAFQDKISIFKANFNLPYLNVDSLFFRCVHKEGVTNKGREEMVLAKTSELNKLKSMIVSKMDSSSKVKSLACSQGSESLYKNGKLDVDNLMCAIVEESVIELGDSAVRCDKIGSSMHSDRFSNASDSRQAGATLAKADTVPLESKPMPEVMASQVGKPIGLTPALAQVDQAVPGSGTAASEGNIASGAVRGTYPNTAAIQAGAAFAPVYEKLSGMASSVSSSGRTSVIGRSNARPNYNATGIVTDSRELPPSNSGSVYPSSIVGTGASSITADAKNNEGDIGKATKATNGPKRSAAGNGEVSPVGGPRPISLGGSGSAGSSRVAASVAAGAANSEAISAEAVATVQKKINQLNTPAQVISFFKEEASNIPDLRSLLYSDATSRLLATKGIRVVNQSGDVSGESMTKAKYVFSDDGIKFTKLNVGKKN